MISNSTHVNESLGLLACFEWNALNLVTSQNASSLWTTRFCFWSLLIFLFLGFYKISEVLTHSIEFVIHSRGKERFDKNNHDHVIEWNTCPETPACFFLRSCAANCFVLTYPLTLLVLKDLEIESIFDGVLIITASFVKLFIIIDFYFINFFFDTGFGHVWFVNPDRGEYFVVHEKQ